MKPTLSRQDGALPLRRVARARRHARGIATGFTVGLMEWTSVQLLAPHPEAGEGSPGVHIDVSHKAATPVGFTITVQAKCLEVRGPRARFAIRAHDGMDEIGSGNHRRFVVYWDRFNKSVAPKAVKANAEVDA
jgi:fluoroacetyl-CoA thioesterase